MKYFITLAVIAICAVVGFLLYRQSEDAREAKRLHDFMAERVLCEKFLKGRSRKIDAFDATLTQCQKDGVISQEEIDRAAAGRY